MQRWITTRAAVLSLLIAGGMLFSVPGCEQQAAEEAKLRAEVARQAELAAAQAAEAEAHFSIEVTSDTFAELVLNADQPVMVDFWAPWCGPCLQLGPTVEQVAKDYQGKAVVAKLNVDDAQDLAAKYGVDGIPALLFFDRGEVVSRLGGFPTAAEAMAAELDQIRTAQQAAQSSTAKDTPVEPAAPSAE